MNENIAFSVIIPHRNIPLLLRRCLASIPKRPDVQVIVVDDGSDPGIVDFQKFPWPKGLCVELLLAKERKGAGYARNLGIKRARGKWLIFADADDYFTAEELLNELVAETEEKGFTAGCKYTSGLAKELFAE